MAAETHHQVLIVGGGTAGITVAASLKRRASKAIDIAIAEPSDTHYYQPALTLVGAGAYDLVRTHRPTASLVPSGVKLIKAAAHKFDPPNDVVELLNKEINKTIQLPDVREAWAKQGAIPMQMSVAEFDAYLKKDIEKWAEVVKVSGAKAN